MVDILGLKSSTNGRSSNDHEVNGEIIDVGSLIQFKRVKMTIEDMKSGLRRICCDHWGRQQASCRHPWKISGEEMTEV